MLQFTIKTFESISATEVYKILRLRSEVFVVEQDCVYQDIDNLDQKAYHVTGYKNDLLIAYARIFKPGDYFNYSSIGRVLVKKRERYLQYGHQLVDVSIRYITENLQEREILISAQTYLLKFYNTHGFRQQGDEYLEDGIPHIKMLRTS